MAAEGLLQAVDVKEVPKMNSNRPDPVQVKIAGEQIEIERNELSSYLSEEHTRRKNSQDWTRMETLE